MPLEEPSADEKQNILLSELARGAKETFANAEQLFQEACLLRQHGAIARAVFLHQISMEECAKVEILGGHATGLLMGYEVDPKRLVVVLASHKAKNRTNAYMLEPNEEELAARRRADWRDEHKAFSKLKNEFHRKSNARKNASLYVDFEGEKFVTPTEKITEHIVTEIAARNEEYLGLMYPKLNMLLKWERNPKGIKETLTQFKTRTEQLKMEFPDDPRKAMEILMREMLEEALAKQRER